MLTSREHSNSDWAGAAVMMYCPSTAGVAYTGTSNFISPPAAALLAATVCAQLNFNFCWGQWGTLWLPLGWGPASSLLYTARPCIRRTATGLNAQEACRQEEQLHMQHLQARACAGHDTALHLAFVFDIPSNGSGIVLHILRASGLASGPTSSCVLDLVSSSSASAASSASPSSQSASSQGTASVGSPAIPQR